MKKSKLFLLHFAGGNKYSFQFLLPFLKEFDVIPLELPGRGKRIQESLIKDYRKAVDDYFEQINSQVNSNDFFIYGHSMGATLGLLVAKKLEEVNKAPKILVFTGNPSPGVQREIKNRYLMPHDEFVSELKRLGGVSDEFFKHEELFDFFEPILRADFEVLEKEIFEPEITINIPIFAGMGKEEQEVDQITSWARFTSNEFEYTLFEGGHFFIQKHPDLLAKMIVDAYNRFLDS